MSNDSPKNINSTPDEKGESSNQGSNTQNAITPSEIGAEASPPSQLPNSENNSESSNDDPNQPNPEAPNWCEKGIFWAEVIGVLGLAAYCVVTFLEWRTFDSERQTMESEFKQSQTNFVIQMDEARKQRDVDNRAWVFVTIPNGALVVSNNTGTTNVGAVNVLIKNIGKTPAHVTSFYTHWTVESIRPSYDPPGPKQSFMIIPGDQITIAMIVPIDEAARIFNNEAIYQYGTVYYSDVFGSNHWSQFCFRFAESGRLMIHEQYHNSCDDFDMKPQK